MPLVPRVELRTACTKGRGVFSLAQIEAGSVVELSPILLFKCPHKDLPAVIANVVFNWSFLARLAEENWQAIALGYGGMYNDANPANLRYEAVADDADGPLLRFIAAREIGAGEELTICYSAHGGGDKWKDNHWWDDRDVRRID
jgi:hypothetical protein